MDSIIRRRRPVHDLYAHPARVSLPEAVETAADVGQLRMEIDFEHPCDGGYCHT